MALWLCRHGYGYVVMAMSSWLYGYGYGYGYGSMVSCLRLYAATATALRLYVFASGSLPCFAGPAGKPCVVHVPGKFDSVAWGHPAANNHLIRYPLDPRISLFVAIYRLFVSFKEGR